MLNSPTAVPHIPSANLFQFPKEQPTPQSMTADCSSTPSLSESKLRSGGKLLHRSMEVINPLSARPTSGLVDSGFRTEWSAIGSSLGFYIKKEKEPAKYTEGEIQSHSKCSRKTEMKPRLILVQKCLPLCCFSYNIHFHDHFEETLYA